MRSSHIFIILALMVFSSCRKDVTPVMPEYKEKLVVEGFIETGSPATVYLSRSVPYFGSFDYTRPEQAFIKGGVVTITDGTTTETLREIYPQLGYLYLGSAIIGQPGKTYSIRVTHNGRSFETSSTILTPPTIDSLYFRPQRDSLGFIFQKFTEPAGTGDCYRWFAKRLGKDLLYAAPFNSAFDDKFIDGTTFDFGYDRGRQPLMGQTDGDDFERGFYKMGDTVVVKFCKMGRREYEFWFTYYQNKTSNGNPFSSPANVRSMFSDYENCFGSFVAYAPVFDTIIIPKE